MIFNSFLGVNNVLHAAALTVREKGQAVGQYLRHAFNIDLDDRGRAVRRDGRVLVASLTDAHSFWSGGGRSFYVLASELYEITDLSSYADTLLTTLSSNAPMSYEDINGDIFFSNGTDSGKLLAGDAYPVPWSLAVPAAPLTSVTTGTLPAGKYLLSLTFSTTLGEEGGAAPAQVIDLPSGGGISVTLPSAAPGSAFLNVYLSAAKGGVMTRHATVAVGASSVVISAVVDGPPLTTEFLQPQPAGVLLASHYSVLLVAIGTTLTYSEPRTPGRYLPSKGYILFPHDIRCVAPCPGGVYVATTKKTYWLEGTDISKAKMTVILPYGAPRGEVLTLPGETDVTWFSDMGAIVADGTGQPRAIQASNVATDTADTVQTMVREIDGRTTLLAVLSGNVTASPLRQAGIAAERAERLSGL